MTSSTPGLTLRSYQQDAKVAVLDSFSFHRGVLVSMATGLGKTPLFCAVAEAMRPHGRILVLAHRRELVEQAESKMREWTDLAVSIEMAERRADDLAGLATDVTVASVQSMAARLRRYDRDAFGLLVIDEAHHSVAPAYRRILDYFENALVLGVTATPDRGDHRGLGAVFESLAYSYELRDAIENGWLVPIRQRAVRVESIDLAGVRTTAGDLNEGDLERVLTEQAPLHGIAEPLVRFAERRPTLVFGATVAHTRALAETIGCYTDPATVAWLDGSSPTAVRTATLNDFKAGTLRFLVNCALFTEGVDVPGVQCVAVARPTKSRPLYAQMIGRGTRTAPEKRDLLVLDFNGNAGRHRLVSLFDALSGGRDEAVEARAQRIMDEESVTVLPALRRAQDEITEQRRRDLLFSVRASMVDIDPFALLGVQAAPGRWGGIEMTDRQREVIESAGLPSAGLDRGQAAEVIDAIVQRRQDGRCSYKQAKVLARFGYDPELSFADAAEVIQALADNGWKRADGTRPRRTAVKLDTERAGAR